MKDLKIKNSIRQNLPVVFGIIFLLFQPVNSVLGQQDRKLEREKQTAQTEKRIALVIGNGDYVNARKLTNPVNDANDMAAALRDLGFEVISGTNLSLRQMDEKVREFGDKILVTGAVALFYYAGHGIQVDGVNYLIPVEADIPREDEIKYVTLNFEQVLRKMGKANNGMNIIILDACRNNPFARSWSRDLSDGGLAQVNAPTGTIIAYATSPNETASDGAGRNGLYTAELLKVIKQPNLKIEEAFKAATIAVDRASGGKQTPWFNTSLRGDFYFLVNKAAAAAAAAAPTNPINIAATNPQPIVPKTDSSTTRMPSAEEILTKFSKAVGYEKYGSITSLVQKGSLEAEGNGKKATGLIEIYSKKPDSSLSAMVSGNISLMQGFSGDKGWTYEPGTGTKDATSQEIEAFKRGAAVGSGDLNLIRRFYPKITVRGIEKLGNSDVYVLEATRADGKSEIFYIDTTTSLLSRWDSAAAGLDTQQGINVLTQTYFEDYIDINGFHIPMTVRQKSANMTLTFKYDVYQTKYNVPLSDNLFKKP